MLISKINYKILIGFFIFILTPSLCCSKSHEENFRDKIAKYTQEIKKNPKRAWSYYKRAGEYYHLKKYDESIKDLKEAIKIDSKVEDFYGALSHSYRGKGMYNESLEAINKAITLDPKRTTYYYYRAICYDNLKRTHESIKDYTKFLKSKPVVKTPKELDLPKEYFYSHKRRAILFFNVNEFKKSVEDANEAINIFPKDPVLYSVRATSNYHLHKYDEVIKDLKLSLKIDPTFNYSYIQLVQVYLEKNQKKEGEKYFIKALENGYNDYKFIYSMKILINTLGKDRVDELISKYSRKKN